MIDIFLSRPTWVEDKYSKGLDNFLRFLKSHDLNPRTIGSSDYPTESPLDEVISLMEKCTGTIILGYPQILIEKGFVKGHQISGQMILPTEWNHIEGALAYAKGLPVLFIHHKGVKRGVFDRGAVNKFLYEIDLTDPGWPLGKNISGAINSWLPKVKAYVPKPDAQREKQIIEIPSDRVTIGTFSRDTLLAEIRAKIFLNEKSQPNVDIFLDRLQRISPYCPSCCQPLKKKRASWMADGVQIGYKCDVCKTEYNRNYSEVYGEVKAEVRKNYQKYWEVYHKEIVKITNGKGGNFKSP